VFLPNPNTNEQNTDGGNWLDNFFLIEPFYKDGVSYYSYRYYIAIGIVINSVTTLLWEKWFIVRLTAMFDEKQKLEKDKAFEAKMMP